MGNRHSNVYAAASPGERAHRQVVLRLRVLHERSDWHTKQTKHGRYYDETDVTWTNHKALRATLDIPASAETVGHLVTCFDQMPKFDPDCDHVELYKPSIFPEVDALRIALKRTAPLAKPRDFGVLWSVSTTEADYAMVSAYVEAGPLVPDRGGYVRGTCHAYGFIVERGPDARTCRVHLLMCLDVNGWVPQSIIDFTAPAMLRILDNIRDLAIARDGLLDPRVDGGDGQEAKHGLPSSSKDADGVTAQRPADEVAAG